MDFLSEDILGVTAIENVKLSDAKEWALRMQAKGIAYNSIHKSQQAREPYPLTLKIKITIISLHILSAL